MTNGNGMSREMRRFVRPSLLQRAWTYIFGVTDLSDVCRSDNAEDYAQPTQEATRPALALSSLSFAGIDEYAFRMPKAEIIGQWQGCLEPEQNIISLDRNLFSESPLTSFVLAEENIYLRPDLVPIRKERLKYNISNKVIEDFMLIPKINNYINLYKEFYELKSA